MATYTARFNNGGSETRASVRPYTHAYRIVANGRMGTTGFATSLERARKASRGDNTRYYDGAGIVEIVEVAAS